MSNLEELEVHIKALLGILDKKMIRKDADIKNSILSLINSSDTNPKFKRICIAIMDNLQMSQ